jgi:hypothetical protein
LSESSAPNARLVALALGLAVAAAGVGYVLGGSKAALGAVAGSLVAAGYSWSFLRAHVARTARGAGLDATIAGGAMARLVVSGAVGIAMWMVGRPAIMAYLAAFGASFAILTAPQVLKVMKQIRSRPATPGPQAVVEPGGDTV